VRLVSVLTLACGCPSGPSSAGSSDAIAQGEPAPPADAAPGPGRTPAQIRSEGNHLVGEPSPYLEQHAHNPVDWYPWGDEALAKAKREGKPIFLSIGYSTCHWCHVMERESFADDGVAAFLNEHFVAIKVDREQRPDVDAIYIEAVGALGGSTGWPLNVFLTPDGVPILGGTYWPREGDGKRPGFLDVAGEVQRTWSEHGEQAAQRGKAVMQRLAEHAASSPTPVDVAMLDTAMVELASKRDDVRGGFGSRQKFPQGPLLLAELRYAAGGDGPARDAAREHVVLSLERMMRGGLRDHLAGTFHRYTVDADWHVPHFEKTLYDNAQLAALFVEAGLRWQRPDFVDVGRAVLDDLIASWRVDGGGFIVGFDADDPGGEGAFYTWTRAELDAVLAPHEAELVALAFGVDAQVDGQREAALAGRSVLARPPRLTTDAELATALATDAATVRTVLDRVLPELARARASRPAPARDDKVLVGWNALAIATLADAGRWLGEPKYIAAAEEAAAFVHTHATHAGVPQRGVRGGRALGPAFLDDRALWGLALVRLHAANGDVALLGEARAVADEILAHHHDAARAGFLRASSERASTLPVAMLDMDDGPLPAGGTAATLLLLELGTLAGDDDLRTPALDVLARWGARAREQPMRAGTLLVAIDIAIANVHEVVVAGERGDATADALWRELATTSSARVLSARIPARGADEALEQAFPAFAGKRALTGKPTAFVCERGSCRAPTSDPAKLRDQLTKIERARTTDRPSGR